MRLVYPLRVYPAPVYARTVYSCYARVAVPHFGGRCGSHIWLPQSFSFWIVAVAVVHTVHPGSRARPPPPHAPARAYPVTFTRLLRLVTRLFLRLIAPRITFYRYVTFAVAHGCRARFPALLPAVVRCTHAQLVGLVWIILRWIHTFWIPAHGLHALPLDGLPAQFYAFPIALTPHRYVYTHAAIWITRADVVLPDYPVDWVYSLLHLLVIYTR